MTDGPDTPIIRRNDHMDRGCVNRQKVLCVCRSLGRRITTSEVAEFLGVPEYPVRAAISWLMAGGFIRQAGSVTRRTRNGHPYIVAAYVWTGRDGEIMPIRRNPEERPPLNAADYLPLALAMANWRR